MFPDTAVNYVNAGLSGTPSVLGVVRAERDLFGEKQPDIIFIEFAVNDGGDQQYKDCYESLVKKCLDKENAPQWFFCLRCSKIVTAASRRWRR